MEEVVFRFFDTIEMERGQKQTSMQKAHSLFSSLSHFSVSLYLTWIGKVWTVMVRLFSSFSHLWWGKKLHHKLSREKMTKEKEEFMHFLLRFLSKRLGDCVREGDKFYLLPSTSVRKLFSHSLSAVVSSFSICPCYGVFPIFSLRKASCLCSGRNWGWQVWEFVAHLLLGNCSSFCEDLVCFLVGRLEVDYSWSELSGID